MTTLKAQLPLASMWAVIGGLSAAAVVPYALALQARQLETVSLPVPLPALVVLQVVQNGVLMFGCALLGLTLGRAVALDSPIARVWLRTRRLAMSRRHAMVSVGVGVGVAAMILALDAMFGRFMPPVPAIVTVGLTWWKGLLASFYGGIGEEIFLRLFVMTLLTWLVWRVVYRRAVPVPPAAYWIGIGGAALLFGVGHLPAAAAVWPLTSVVITRTLLLNGVAGIATGWLYWKFGLEYAMVGHFSADIVLHVAVPLVAP